MSLRVSNTTIARNYTRNLNRNTVRLSDLNYKATSWRKFSSMAENTPGGVRAMELRRNLARLDTNRDNAQSALSLIQAAEGQLSNAHDITKAFHEKIVQANNGTNAETGREALAQELTRMREQMVTLMNARFSDRYLFGGLDIANPPFQYSAQGIPDIAGAQAALAGDMTTAAASITDPTQQADVQAAIAALDAQLSSDPDDTAAVAALFLDLKDKIGAVTVPANTKTELQQLLGGVKNQLDPPKLTFLGQNVATTLNPSSPWFDQKEYNLAKRDYYVDIGLGIGFDTGGNVDPNTVYKTSFDGLEIFGEGNQNIIFLMDNIIEALKSEDFDPDYVGELLGDPNKSTGFLAAADAISLQVVSIGADTNYLEFLIDRMNDEEINLFERQKQVEALDPAKAILDYELEYTAYQAALQMGQRLLMPTLWDYVK